MSLCTSPIIHIFDSQKVVSEGPPFPPALPPFRPTLVVPQARHVVCGEAKGGLACGASSLRGRHCFCDSLHPLALLPLRRMLLACGSELARWPDGLVQATRARAARRNHSSQPEAFACDRRLSIPMAVKHKGGGGYVWQSPNLVLHSQQLSRRHESQATRYRRIGARLKGQSQSPAGGSAVRSW